MEEKRVAKHKKVHGASKKAIPSDNKTSDVDEYDRTVLLEYAQGHRGPPETPPGSPSKDSASTRPDRSPTAKRIPDQAHDSSPKNPPKKQKGTAADASLSPSVRQEEPLPPFPPPLPLPRALKVFCCVDHDAPVGIPPASIVVAPDEESAAELLDKALLIRNLATKSEKDYSLCEIDTSAASASLLSVCSYTAVPSASGRCMRNDRWADGI